MCCSVIETSSDLPRISSVIFGNLWKFSGNFRKRFDWPSDNFWRISGDLRKVFYGYGFYLLVFNSISARKTVLDHISKHEKRVENATHSEVFLTIFEVFGNVVKHCSECLIYLLNREDTCISNRGELLCRYPA